MPYRELPLLESQHGSTGLKRKQVQEILLFAWSATITKIKAVLNILDRRIFLKNTTRAISKNLQRENTLTSE